LKLGRVIGTVVASTAVEGLEGVKYLIVQPLDRKLRPRGHAVVAGDGVQMAGPGETVYYVSSREAALAMPNTFVPVDDAIVGIVDHVHEDGGE
jgi:microcompartment protein CcmK/EutM